MYITASGMETFNILIPLCYYKFAHATI